MIPGPPDPGAQGMIPEPPVPGAQAVIPGPPAPGGQDVAGDCELRREHERRVREGESPSVWQREDTNANCFLTTLKRGPEWGRVVRRVTEDMHTNEVIEDIPTIGVPDKVLHRLLALRGEIEEYTHYVVVLAFHQNWYIIAEEEA